MAAPVAVVTGGNRGIGREVVRGRAARGFDTVLGSRDPARGEEAARGLSGVRVAPLDVADPSTIEALAAGLDRCDVLVNNAAIHYDTWQQARSADLGAVHEALETNLFGAWRMCLALLPLIRESPHGRIVNVSSGAGSLDDMRGGTPAYRVSKVASTR